MLSQSAFDWQETCARPSRSLELKFKARKGSVRLIHEIDGEREGSNAEQLTSHTYEHQI